MEENFSYLSGFGNECESEAVPGTLPQGRNAPQRPPHGLYTEQITGVSFTLPRKDNLRSWQYRIRPSVLHSGSFEKYEHPHLKGTPFAEAPTPPTPMRWDPLEYPSGPVDFIDSLRTVAGNGSLHGRNGNAIHLYAATSSMKDRYFYSADGEFLIVPQEGDLKVLTEMGRLRIAPSEIAVIPRGIKFQVELPGDNARGYVCENYGTPVRPPDLGPIGSNGLANTRDFKIAKAWYEDREGEFELIAKFEGNLWRSSTKYSPFDVVGWHGNYAPYKYDLKRFNTIGTVSYDHPDPSIFTVLTSSSERPGVANLDLVIFPDRWMVGEDTFRPPYYHRNSMSEFMGLIYGAYDAKGKGFVPGGLSVHNAWSAHGPDARSFEKASNADLKPQKYEGTLAFMFESRMPWQLTEFALKTHPPQSDYLNCWQGLRRQFEK